MKQAEGWHREPGLSFGLQQPALIGSVRLGPQAGRHSAALERLLARLLDEPAPPSQKGQAPSERAAVLFAWAHGQVQRQSRIAVSERFHLHRARGRASDEPFWEFALPAPEPKAAQLALRWTQAVFGHAAAGLTQAQAEALREQIHEQLRPFANPGLNAFSIVMAAHRAGIPLQKLTRDVVVLGTGNRSRWMESTLTDATSSIGCRIAKTKHATSRVLRAAGLPGGVNLVVRSAEEAVAAAAQLGYPVVVKPADQDQGLGVSADLRDAAAVAEAFAQAAPHSQLILVEKWAPGFTHRLTVFNGKVIRVTRRIAGGVVGDGVRDVAALVALQQQSPQQQRALRRLGKVLLSLDPEALGLLRQNGLEPGHVPAPGEYVRLRRRDNINAGGTNEAVAVADVHPDNLRLAVDAASLLRLDFAGVDLITQDAARSWLEAGGLICEVNSQPQMGARAEPALYQQVLRELVGDDCRVPARLRVCASAEPAQRGALQEALAQEAGGVSAHDGLWLAGRRVTAAFEDGFSAARALLRRTDVGSALCLMTLPELRRSGLPLDLWDEIELPAPDALEPQEKLLLPAVQERVRAHRAAQPSGG